MVYTLLLLLLVGGSFSKRTFQFFFSTSFTCLLSRLVNSFAIIQWLKLRGRAPILSHRVVSLNAFCPVFWQRSLQSADDIAQSQMSHCGTEGAKDLMGFILLFPFHLTTIILPRDGLDTRPGLIQCATRNPGKFWGTRTWPRPDPHYHLIHRVDGCGDL